MSKSNKKQEAVTNNTAKAAKADLTPAEVAIRCLVEQLKVLQGGGFGMSKPAKNLRKADMSLLHDISAYIQYSIPRCKEVNDQILRVKTKEVLGHDGGELIRVIGKEIKTAITEHQIKVMLRQFATARRSAMLTGSDREQAIATYGMPYTKEQGEALVKVIFSHFYEGAHEGHNEKVNHDLVVLYEMFRHDIAPALIGTDGAIDGPTLTKVPFNLIVAGINRLIAPARMYVEGSDWCSYRKAAWIWKDIFDSEEFQTVERLLNAEKTEEKTEEDSGSNGAAVVTNEESGQEPVKGSDMNASKKTENVTDNQAAAEAAATPEVTKAVVVPTEVLTAEGEVIALSEEVAEPKAEAAETQPEPKLEPEAEVATETVEPAVEEVKDAPIQWETGKGVKVTTDVAAYFTDRKAAGRLSNPDTYILGVRKTEPNTKKQLGRLCERAALVTVEPCSVLAQMILMSRLIAEHGKTLAGKGRGAKKCLNKQEQIAWLKAMDELISALEPTQEELKKKVFEETVAKNSELLGDQSGLVEKMRLDGYNVDALHDLLTAIASADRLEAEPASRSAEKGSTPSATNNATTGETPNNETVNEQSKEEEVKEPKTTVMAGLTGWMTDLVSIPSAYTHEWSVRSGYSPAASEEEAKSVMKLLMAASSITGKESAIKEEIPADVGSELRAGLLSLRDTVGRGQNPGKEATAKIAVAQTLIATSLVLNAKKANISLLGGDMDRAFASVKNEDVKTILKDIDSAAKKSGMPLEYYVLGLKKEIAVLEELNGCKDKIQTYKSAVKVILDSGTTQVVQNGRNTTLKASDEIRNLVDETLQGLCMAKSTGEDGHTHSIVPSDLHGGLMTSTVHGALESILSGESSSLYWVMQATNASRVKNMTDGVVYTVAVGTHLVTVGATETINYMVGLTGHSIDTVIQSLIWSWVRMTQGAEAAEAQVGTLKQVAGNLIEIAAVPFVIAESFGASLKPDGMWTRICDHYSPKDEAGQPTESKTKRTLMFIPRTVTGIFKVSISAVSWTARTLWSGAKKACSWIGGLFSKKTETKAAPVATS